MSADVPFPQRPDRTPLFADAQLGPLAVAAAAGFCAAVWADDRVLVRTPVYFGCGLLGLLAARLVHNYRCLGLVPTTMTVAAAAALVGAVAGDWPGWAVGLFPGCVGAAAGGVLRYRDRVRLRPRRFALVAVAAAVAAVTLVVLFANAGGSPGWVDGCRWLAVGAAATSAALAWPTLFRPFVEQLFCLAARVLYWPRAVGPGLAAFPDTGPVLVVANHADWFDPGLVGGQLPRVVTPLMTAGFFDKPPLRWLMGRVFGVIRVPEAAVRREAPEIDEGVKALDLDKVVLLFPEGYLRRTEGVPLRRFGQGVWKLLHARPDTPVVPCWVEGTWGSIFSHHGGPPLKNKRFRPFRRVTVGVGPPLVVPPEVLSNRMGTRLFLMQKVADARLHAGLPPLPPVDQLPADKDDA